MKIEDDQKFNLIFNILPIAIAYASGYQLSILAKARFGRIL